MSGEALICKRYMKVAFAHTGPKMALFTRLRCKQWSCPECAKTNAWIWRNWLLKRIPEVSNEWWLLTLTANSQTRSHKMSLENIRKNLDAFFKRVKRVFGRIEYVRVYEKHPTSEAIHCHIIITGVTPFVALGFSSKLRPMSIGCLSRGDRNGNWAIKSWVKHTAQELKMGFIADIRVIAGECAAAVWYVTKNLTIKQGDVHEKGLRHVQVTSGIGSPPKSEEALVWHTSAYITASMVGHKTNMRDLQTGAVINDNHWEHTGYYPVDDD